MKNLTPALRIKLSDSSFQILELTLNPIFLVGKPEVPLMPFRRREFDVYIEFVLGHDEEACRQLPDIHLLFSGAFGFDAERRPPLNDVPRKSSTRVFLAPTRNEELFGSYLEDDFLTQAYGSGATKNLLREPKASFAFERSNYREMPAGHEESGIYERTNYPSSFSASFRENGGGWESIVTPRPFSLETNVPVAERMSVSKKESVSLWFWYPYLEAAADFADDPGNDLFTFLHDLELSQNQAALNYFPRLPGRYSPLASDPEIILSPRLPVDPSCWLSKKEHMYPWRSDGGIDLKDGTISFFFAIRDEKVAVDRSLFTILAGLVAGFFVSVIASQWLLPSEERNAKAIGISVAGGLAAFFYIRAVFDPLLSRKAARFLGLARRCPSILRQAVGWLFSRRLAQ